MTAPGARRAWRTAAGRLLILALGAVACASTLAWAWLTWWPPREHWPIPFSSVVHDTGHAFVAPLAIEDTWLTTFPSDGLDDGLRSRLRLFEDGIELGPAHMPHDAIRSGGHGAFSHWYRQLYFASSDGSDPTANGRVYEIETAPAFQHIGILSLEFHVDKLSRPLL